MHAFLLLTVVSVSSAEPMVRPTKAEAAPASFPSASDAPRVQEPTSETPGSAAPPETPEPQSGESVRQQALKRSRVPRYPRLERPGFWVAGIAGLGLATAGGLYYGKALEARETLDKRKALTRAEVLSTSETGRNAQTTALVLGGASLLAFGAATWFYLQPLPEEGTRVSIAAGPGGGLVSIRGVLP